MADSDLDQPSPVVVLLTAVRQGEYPSVFSALHFNILDNPLGKKVSIN